MNSTFCDILVVDDDGAIRTHLARILTSAGFTVRTATNGDDAVQAIEQRCPYFVISDWRMSPVDGIQLFRHIRQATWPHYVYLLMLSVQPDHHDITNGFMAGADDFLTKPVHAIELLARLEAGSRVLELERRLGQLASMDSLTGLLNRRMGAHLLDKEWSRAIRYKHPLSCVMWDLDEFRSINDTHGRLAGDAVLRAAARLVETISRRSDYICRWGGDEFLVILPETNEEGAACWAKRFGARLATMECGFKGQPITVTASFGAAERLEGMWASDNVVDAADQALQAAKKAGRQGIVVSQSIHAKQFGASPLLQRAASGGLPAAAE
jgi:two-component system, cell cycle response regulator